ncbi:uncharacterized protein [Diabrotica undecimpunctata]|uniref:uncharacterized protein n=1 Tax=Diabrotica undecimpunctata TaxID=50387 RepID=UPI003B63E510
MVLQCCICKKKTKYLHPDLSFHLFPNNIDDRTIWVANLGENIKVSKYSRICSTHFRLGDFEIKPSGKNFLKIGAIPVSEVDSELVLRSETSSKRLFVDTPEDNASHLNFKYNVNAPGPSSIKRSKVILDRQASTNSSSDTGSVENFEMDIDPAGRSLKSTKRMKKEQLLLKYLLAEEIEDEEMLSVQSLEKHAIFKRRQEEG